ncbi:hypothetical protein CONPUDRAFT_165366 [Coniophora puteana RWD-64-598 SS2]|uniref:RhoGAP-domain-containing protein n=1 Tax=Coniophora puteana (strain RWD-64-598) TaxID=741705 RepID=A0A5M3MPU5_CONPW|nr:uncharacterized protein CONPUDRAFT_165366 [Coniophora puteana RWD-64-598 SS2]EIW81153.1 hypothetical protein CONPUDRAFT_165366 [Coniophora puteana RWD-64-598 SS2]
MAPSLKQRLAALSTAATSQPPFSQDADLFSPGGRRKIFNAPWRRNTQDSSGGEELSGRTHDRVQDVMDKVIFQAGVDYETRPMVIMNASGLPDPKEVSYDILLTRILSYLDLYVESDYTVVFFAAGGRHTPSWNWVWKAYRSLSRKYRKNLKRLYIVHSSFFSKMLFSLAGAIISPKFFRKIEYISTLSELARHVPLTQIDVPPAVYQENSKQERQITLPTPHRSNVFGVPLEEIMGYDGEKGGIPRVVKDAIQYLREFGLNEDGLFRRSPNSVLLKQVQDAYDRGQVVSLETFNDPALASVLIKKYLRDLPQPIFPEHLYPTIRRCPQSADEQDMAGVEYIRNLLLPQLAPCTYILLSNVIHLMHDVSLRASQNRMDAHNLAVVLTPNLVAGQNPMRDVMMCAVPGPSLASTSAPTIAASLSPSSSSSSGSPATASSSPTLVGDAVEGRNTLGSVVKLCITRYYEIFDEVRDPSEPVRRPRGASSESPSPTPTLSSASYASGSLDKAGVMNGAGGGGGVNGYGASGYGASGAPVVGSRRRPQTTTNETDPADPMNRLSTGSWVNAGGRPLSYGSDGEIDDSMLVMPIGPGGAAGGGDGDAAAGGFARENGNGAAGNGSEITVKGRAVMEERAGGGAWDTWGRSASASAQAQASSSNSNSNATTPTQTHPGPVTFPYKPRQRKASAPAPVRTGPGSGMGSSMHGALQSPGSISAASSGAPSPSPGGTYTFSYASYTSSRSKTKTKARSTISIDRGSHALGSGRGSISIGRGALRKAAGAGVEAVGITASGFFTPEGAPPVPAVPSGRVG